MPDLLKISYVNSIYLVAMQILVVKLSLQFWLYHHTSALCIRKNPASIFIGKLYGKIPLKDLQGLSPLKVPVQCGNVNWNE